MLISTAYFPPVEYFALLAKYSVVYVEACENYIKQTWRNRCRILTANGVEDLRVPVIHNGLRRIDEILVDYSTPWLRRSEYAIESAYSNSPFFEYYRDPLFAILDSRPKTLWELNSRITQFFCEKTGIAPEFIPTKEFTLPPERDCDALAQEDYRYLLSPKKESEYRCRPYWQLFSEKFGFTPGLSIMDLLFNEGPESICYLK